MHLNNRGITAAELLIVIVILGVLATIAVPVVGNIQENSQRDALIGESQIIENQLDTYCRTEEDPACTVDWGQFDENETLGDSEEPEEWHVRAEDVDSYLEGHEGDFVAWQQNDQWLMAHHQDALLYAGRPLEHDDREENVLEVEEDEDIIAELLDDHDRSLHTLIGEDGEFDDETDDPVLETITEIITDILESVFDWIFG